ncbi:MAG: 23S rRNA (guanosine(2251)-2'-O)-methyltransferase RlmB [Gammaproteobacteria bacterium]|nr:23S rRNA (guanosine(2251)-2'-O)-methyltransferase RlmB [Gammaproteobacteria bacterium]
MSTAITCWGLHPVRALLRTAADSILEAYSDAAVRSTELEQLRAELGSHGVKVQLVPRQTLERLAEGGRHQGIVVRRRPLPPLSFDVLLDRLSASTTPALLLVLDGVQDPQNLGSCLRVADAAGCAAVIVPKDRSAGMSGAVVKAASGAADTMPLVTVTNLSRALEALREAGVWTVGTTGEASDALYDVDLTGSVAIVMGGEAKGIRQLTRDHCDYVVRIPMAGSVESLNVATAAAICVYEAVRQRSAGKS